MTKKELLQRIKKLEAENTQLKIRIGVLEARPIMAPIVVPSPVCPKVTPPTYRDPYAPSRTGDISSAGRPQSGGFTFGTTRVFEHHNEIE